VLINCGDRLAEYYAHQLGDSQNIMLINCGDRLAEYCAHQLERLMSRILCSSIGAIDSQNIDTINDFTN
jgi:hypothetical protein